jgi:hypothetical protein
MGIGPAPSKKLIEGTYFDTGVLTLTPPVTPTPGTTTEIYTHDLGFVPAFIAFWEFDGVTHVPIPKYWFTAAGASAFSLEAEITSTELRVSFSYLAASPAGYPGPIDIRYYFLQESAN